VCKLQCTIGTAGWRRNTPRTHPQRRGSRGTDGRHQPLRLVRRDQGQDPSQGYPSPLPALLQFLRMSFRLGVYGCEPEPRRRPLGAFGGVPASPGTPAHTRCVTTSHIGEWTPACKCYGHVAPTADSLVPCGRGHCRFATCGVSSWHGRPEWNSRCPAPGTSAGHGAPDGSSEAGFEESSVVGVTAEGSNRVCGLFGAGEMVQFAKASPQALRLDIYGSFCFIFGTGGQARRRRHQSPLLEQSQRAEFRPEIPSTP